jgi:hypothetical protein
MTRMIPRPDRHDESIEALEDEEILEVLDAQEKDDPIPLSWSHAMAAEVYDLRTQVGNMNVDLDRERVQMAGCLMAAEGSRDPDLLALKQGDYAWSPALAATRQLSLDAERMKRLLERLDSRGGLGPDVHREIREAVGLPPHPWDVERAAEQAAREAEIEAARLRGPEVQKA